MKKSFVLGLAILFVAGLAMTACIGIAKPGALDFSLTVTLDKTETSVGDTVTATVIAKNVSGRRIHAELPDWIAAEGGRYMEDILHVVFTPDGHFGFLEDKQDILFEPRPSIIIERGAVLKRKFKHTIKKQEDFYVLAGVFYYTTNAQNFPGTQGLSNRILIKVR